MQWRVGPFRLDRDNACLWKGDERLVLRPKTFDLLVYLVEHAGELVTKDDLFAAVWPETVVAESALTVSMSELRKVLGETARTPQFIATVHRRGYRFIAPVAAEDASPALSTTMADHAPLTRRLAAILSADVQGYSRLMEHDDAATVRTLTTYRAVMTALIEQHHGRVVNVPGDNLLAEFASVVDAVEGAIAIQHDLAQRNRALPDHRQMWFRIGINLGDVIVDGSELYGDGVNVAARLEGLAEGGGICISGTVYDHIETQLDLAYTDLGERAVKNITRPVRVYRVASRSTSVEPPALPALARNLDAPRGLRPPLQLVSRKAELAQLHQMFMAAQNGQRQVLFVTGEAGIGKTTLVDAFVHEVMQTRNVVVSRGQCIDQYGTGEAYLPLLEALGHLLRGPHGANLVTLLKREAPSWLLQLPAFVPDAEFDRLQRRASGVTRERMLRELAELMETLTAQRTLVLVLEDLHWSDVSTVDWLGYVARRREAARLLILGTYRPVDTIVQDHPIRRVTQELQRQGHSREFALPYFTEREIATYLDQRFASASLPQSLAGMLYQRTSGNPFFLATMVEALVQADVLRVEGAQPRIPDLLDAIDIETPESIRALIDQQLRRLEPEDQELLEAASVAGTTFTASAVAVCVAGDAERVENRLEALVHSRQFIAAQGTEVWPDEMLAVSYTFIHSLYQEVIYAQVLASRKARWHHHIGALKETSYGAQAGDIAAELSTHFLRARDGRRAVKYLRQAAAKAMRRHAHQEAMELLRQGLGGLNLVPESERLDAELSLLLLLGAVLIAAKGYAAPEVETTYLRARYVCEHLGASPRLPQVLLGLHAYYSARGTLDTATELGEQCVSLTRGGDPVSRLQAHYALGITVLFRGDLTRAQDHLEQGIALYRPAYHQPRSVQDAGVTCLAYSGAALWTLGAVDQALSRSHDAVALAQELAHPFSLAHALYFLALIHMYRGEWSQAQDRIAASLSLAKVHGLLFWLAMGNMLEGRLRSERGDAERGVAQLTHALTAFRSTGAGMGQTAYLLWIAESQGKVGQPEQGLQTLGQAFESVQQTDERWCEAELYRLQGEYVLHVPTTESTLDAQALAETHFVTALEIARRQHTASWELRAATSLTRLWQHQDKRAEARELLAPVYGRFTEGLDTADLQAAKALLEELG